LAQIEGNWDSQIFLIDSTKKKTTLLTISTEPESPKILPPLDEAPATDSRKVWEKIFEGISSGNDSEALIAKLDVERVQRNKSLQRKSSHTQHQQQLFHLVSNEIQNEIAMKQPTTKHNNNHQQDQSDDVDDDNQYHDVEEEDDAIPGFYLHNNFSSICQEIQGNA